jgi:hypothetical protein
VVVLDIYILFFCIEICIYRPIYPPHWYGLGFVCLAYGEDCIGDYLAYRVGSHNCRKSGTLCSLKATENGRVDVYEGRTRSYDFLC